MIKCSAKVNDNNNLNVEGVDVSISYLIFRSHPPSIYILVYCSQLDHERLQESCADYSLNLLPCLGTCMFLQFRLKIG
jgi:hypothetical protein